MHAPAPATPHTRPLILTLALDPSSQARFEAERQRYYPARLNRIPAHISLFHALPGEEESSSRATLARETAAIAPFALQVYDVLRLGRGVAYSLDAPELDRLHARLRTAWLPWLSRQDQQPFRPHVVIQNKVDPALARTLYDTLSSGFRPWAVQACGLLLWHYEGGPWSPGGDFAFSGSASPAARFTPGSSSGAIS